MIFVSNTQVEKGEDIVYLGNSRTTKVLEKGKVLLKLTSGKTLALSNVLYVPNIRINFDFCGIIRKMWNEDFF